MNIDQMRDALTEDEIEQYSYSQQQKPFSLRQRQHHLESDR